MRCDEISRVGQAMIVTVCSMKKFSGYSLFKMMTRQFGLERTIEPVEPGTGV